MRITIEISEELYEKLRSRAMAGDLSEEQVIGDALETYLAFPEPLRAEMEPWQAASAEAIEKVARLVDEAW